MQRRVACYCCPLTVPFCWHTLLLPPSPRVNATIVDHWRAYRGLGGAGLGDWQAPRPITRARRILIMAVGSGYYGALAVRNTLEELADIPVSIELACEYPAQEPFFLKVTADLHNHACENL